MNVSMDKRKGNITIETDTMLMGEVEGHVTVLPGAKLDLSATVTGDVTLKKFSKAAIRGQINGNVYDEGAQIEWIGAITGTVIQVD